MNTVVQFQMENYEDFKNEIIRGVVDQIKDLGLNNKKEEENLNELISREETAKFLNISTVKLWSLTKANAISKINIGRKVLYKKSDVLDFINSRNKS